MKVYLETYGCTANKSDATILVGLLKQSKYELVSTMDTADVLILLTCTVIGTTEQRMLSRLRCFKKTDKPVIVAGCMASVQPDLIRAIVPDARLLLPQYIHHVIDLIQGDTVAYVEKNKTLLPKHFDGITAPIAIAEGCILSCSYCITQRARGQLSSYPVHEIVTDIQSALQQGCRELLLTSQDTASYGLDIGINLGDLLQDICNINAAFKVRIGMMNPATYLKNQEPILTAYRDPKIYKFLHLPVQSGNNRVLQKMNRLYTVEDFAQIIERFRAAYPHITIATDIIVGFPSETPEQFDDTIHLLETIRPDITNITRYSARPGTPAKTMDNRIPTDIAKQRSKHLTTLCNTIAIENNKQHIGKTCTLLITEKSKNNTFTGRTETYKPVIIKKQVHMGDFVPVEITDATATHLVGSLI
jgi:MiaB-like tRNA modifying enzyme